jgi:CRP-like cAMP-binding protein
MGGDAIDMRMFAQRVGASVTYAPGSVIFNQGEAGACMYIVQSGARLGARLRGSRRRANCH